MSAAIDYSYHKVSEYRGAHRIWIENLLLARSGFTAGANYTRRIEQDLKVITLELVQESEQAAQVRTVSKTSDGTPIIDLCNKTISTVFGDHERVLVEYKKGLLVIRCGDSI